MDCVCSQPTKLEPGAVESLVVLTHEQGDSNIPSQSERASDEQTQSDGASQLPKKERILVSAANEQEGTTKNERLIHSEGSTNDLTQSTKVNEKQLEMVQDNQSKTIQDWFDIADEELSQVISFLEVIQTSLPPPGDLAVSALIIVTKLAQIAVCNHQNIKSLRSRLLNLGQILGSHSERIKERDQSVRKVLNKYYEVTKKAQSYIESYTRRSWIRNVVNVFVDEQRYKILDAEISAVVELLKLALGTSMQQNVETVLDQVKMLVHYEDSNKKLNKMIEELGVDALVKNPKKLEKLLKQLPATGSGVELNMISQVQWMLEEMQGQGPFVYIQQPDLRTFWAQNFPSKRHVEWGHFWQLFPWALKTFMGPEELGEVKQLVLDMEARLRFQETLASDHDGSIVRVLDLRTKVRPDTPLAEVLKETLDRGPKVVPTLPGCAPVPLPDDELVGREDDLQKVVQLLLNNQSSVPAPSETKSLSGCLLLAPGGLGKSRLAVAVAARLNRLGHLKGGGAVFVNLRDASKVEDVVVRIYAALSIKQDPSDTSRSFIASSIAAKVSTLTARGGVVLVLDNAEGAQSDKESVELLHMLFEKMHTIPSRPLLLITSRVPFTGVCSYDVTALAPDAAATLVRNTLCKLPEEETQIIVSACGGVPLTLLMVAKALYAGGISTTELKNALKEAETAVDSDRALRIISLALSVLPLDQQRTLLALSVFPSSFDADDAAAVLELPSATDAIWQLDELLHLSLLSSIMSQNNFLLHPLVRATLMAIESQAEEKTGVLQRARRMFLLHVLDQVFKWGNDAREDGDAMKMALSLARSHMVDIEQALSLLMTADELSADVWDAATRKLAQSVDFLQALGLMHKDSLLDAASAFRRHWQMSQNDSNLDAEVLEKYKLLGAWASCLKGDCLSARGLYVEAEALYEETLKVRRDILGLEDLQVLASMNDLAACLQSRGFYPRAKELFEQTYERRKTKHGETHRNVLASMNNLAWCMCDLGDYAGALKLLKETSVKVSHAPGPEHPDTLSTLGNMAFSMNALGDHAGARGLYEEIIEIKKRVFGQEHPEVMTTVNNLALCLIAQGDYASAKEHLGKALEVKKRVVGEEHPDVLTVRNNIALCVMRQGDLLGAEKLYEEIIETSTRILGKEHRNVLHSMNNLAFCMNAQERYADAQQLYVEALETQKRVLREEHPDVLVTIRNLALCMLASAEYASARGHFENELEIRIRKYGEENKETLLCYNNLATCISHQGDYVLAQLHYEKAFEMQKRVLGDKHPDTLTSMANLAQAMNNQGDYSGARDLLEKALEIQKLVLHDEHPNVLKTMYNLAFSVKSQGDNAGARDLYEKVINTGRRIWSEEHSLVLVSLNGLATCLQAQGNYAGAQELYKKVLEARKRTVKPGHPDILITMNNLASCKDAQGDSAGARELYAEAMKIGRLSLGQDHPWVLLFMKNLANCMRGQGERANAL